MNFILVLPQIALDEILFLWLVRGFPRWHILLLVKKPNDASNVTNLFFQEVVPLHDVSKIYYFSQGCKVHQ